MDKKVKRGSWLVTVPLAAVTIGYMVLVFLPGRRSVSEAREQIKLKQDYIAQAAGLTPPLRATQQNLTKTRAYIAAWEEHAPAEGSLSVLYGRINALAKAAGTITTRFDPEPVIQHATIREIPLAIGCTGSFTQIFEFLRSLEGLPESIWINDLQLEKREGSGGDISCEINMVVFANNPENSDYVEYSK